MVRVAWSAAGNRGLQDWVQPHDARQVGAGAVVGEEFSHPGFAFSEHQRGAAGHTRVSENFGGHGLRLVPTDHDRDDGVEADRDAGADLVGRGEQVESGPPGSQVVDDADGGLDAESVGFGVEYADVEAARSGVGCEVAHAEHGQGEVVDARALGVVPQRRVDEQRVEGMCEVCSGDQLKMRLLQCFWHVELPKRA